MKAILPGGLNDGKRNSSVDKERSDCYQAAGMRMTVAHRQGLDGSDEGLTFDITTAGSEDEGKRILRFYCVNGQSCQTCLSLLTPITKRGL